VAPIPTQAQSNPGGGVLSVQAEVAALRIVKGGPLALLPEQAPT